MCSWPCGIARSDESKHGEVAFQLTATDFGLNSLWQISYLKYNSWMCILHLYHKASRLKACTAMCRSVKKYLINSKWRHPRFSLRKGRGVFCHERIWNNYVEIQWKNMQVIFIILLCIRGYNSLGDPTRQHEVWRKILPQADPIERLTACVLVANKTKKLNYLTYRTKFDTKMTKIKQTYTAVMIMSVSGTVCHLILLYFPGKQGLAINLTWPVLKNKQRTCVLLPSASADQCVLLISLVGIQFGAITKYIINKIAHSMDIRKWHGIN